MQASAHQNEGAAGHSLVSRKHSHSFAALDGLRGFAALAVALFHFGGYQGRTVLSQSGFLAVDFFFVLSGFVLAYAYEDRFRHGMSFAEFGKVRLLRLVPLATCIALATGVFKLILDLKGYYPHPDILGSWPKSSLACSSFQPSHGATLSFR